MGAKAGAQAVAAAPLPAVEMDNEERALVAQALEAADGAPPPAPGAAMAADAALGPAVEEDMDMDMSDEEEQPVRVVKNYRRPDPRQQAVDTSK